MMMGVTLVVCAGALLAGNHLLLRHRRQQLAERKLRQPSWYTSAGEYPRVQPPRDELPTLVWRERD